MTELNLAYGYPSEDDNTPIIQKKNKYDTDNIQQQQQQQIQQQQIQQQMQQQQQQMQQPKKIETYNYSFWDRMVMSRSDVIKLAVFSLVIVLGISIDRIGTYYINKYLTDNEYSYIQEFLIRLSYPIIIFIILWIIKSL